MYCGKEEERRNVSRMEREKKTEQCCINNDGQTEEDRAVLY